MEQPKYQPQFISHTQVVPPTLVPRRGLGLFGALGFMMIILGGATTGALVLIEKSYQSKVDAGNEELTRVKKDLEISSLQQAQLVQKQIQQGQSLLAAHIYPSQLVEFAERFTLDQIRITQFGYLDGKIQLNLVAPNFLLFTQQIKYYRGLKEVSDLIVQPPRLNERGEVSFSVSVTPSSSLINNPPRTNVEVITPSIGTVPEAQENLDL